MRTIETDNIVTIHTPAGIFTPDPGTLTAGGTQWIGGLSTLVYSFEQGGQPISVVAAAVVAVGTQDGPTEKHDPMATVSPIAAATAATATSASDGVAV